MIDLVDAVMRPGSVQSMLSDYPLIYRAQNLKYIRICKVDDQVVAVVPFVRRSIEIGGCRFSIGIISPTATHPDHRHKGYGLACLRSCLRQMIEDDIDLSVLWTVIETFPFYDHAAYQPVRTQIRRYPCFRQDAPLFTDCGHRIVEYDPASQRYLTDIQRMHEQDIVGVVRQLDEYAALFSLHKMRTLLAFAGDTPVAYLVVSAASNKPGLIEGGGNTDGLQSLLHQALEQIPRDESVYAYGYGTPSVLGDLLERTLGERGEPLPGNMMIRINRPGRFFARICPWLTQKAGSRTDSVSLKVSDTEETISFTFSGQCLHLGTERQTQHAEVTRQELTSLVFGEHLVRRVEMPRMAGNLFPLYFPIWVLDSS